MTDFVVSVGGPSDAEELTEMLNEIIDKGDNTAGTSYMTTEAMRDWINHQTQSSNWVVARATSDNEVWGVQWVGRLDGEPSTTCQMGTFVRIGKDGLGVGPAMFRISEYAARALGFSQIETESRADNESGLEYHRKMGFKEVDRNKDVELSNGYVVDQIIMRRAL